MHLSTNLWATHFPRCTHPSEAPCSHAAGGYLGVRCEVRGDALSGIADQSRTEPLRSGASHSSISVTCFPTSRKELGELIFLHINKRSKLRCFRDQIRMSPRHLPVDPRADPEHAGGDNISHLAWESLGIPQEEQEDMARYKGVGSMQPGG
ncbi:hypothetical protein Q8A73_021107 [Channa argus]|nr:hypothetical protein Q8A73_021107 [Channa argus]